MLGFPFLRQRAIDNYIADFFCKELKLVLELDGYTHQWEETLEKDEKKEKDLNALGYTVLRFKDNEVMLNIHSVSRVIENWILEHHPEKVSSPD